MSDEEREKHKKHIENVIEETFKIIKLVYANQQEKEGLKGSSAEGLLLLRAFMPYHATKITIIPIRTKEKGDFLEKNGATETRNSYGSRLRVHG